MKDLTIKTSQVNFKLKKKILNRILFVSVIFFYLYFPRLITTDQTK